MHSFVAAPDRPPFYCISCHGGAGSDRDWFLDLGENVTGDSEEMDTIYICNLCLVAICHEKGIVVQEPLLAKIDSLETDLFEARRKADGLDQGLTGLIRARFFSADDPAVRELAGFLEDPPADMGTARDGQGDLAGGAGVVAQPSDGQDLGAVRPSISIHGGVRG